MSQVVRLYLTYTIVGRCIVLQNRCTNCDICKSIVYSQNLKGHRKKKFKFIQFQLQFNLAVLVFSDDFQTAQLSSLILELLTFCVEHHTYHIKNYIISKDLLRRVLVLLKSRHAFVALCKYCAVVSGLC